MKILLLNLCLLISLHAFAQNSSPKELNFADASVIVEIKNWVSQLRNLQFADFSNTGMTAEEYSQKMVSVIETFEGFTADEIPNRHFENRDYSKDEKYAVFHHALAKRAGLETSNHWPVTKLFISYVVSNYGQSYLRTPLREFHPEEYEPCSFYIEHPETKTGPTSQRPKELSREEQFLELFAKELVKKGYKQLQDKEFAKYVILGLGLDEIKKQDWSSSRVAFHSVPYVRADLQYSSQAYIDTSENHLLFAEDYSKLRKIPFWKPLAESFAVKALAGHFYECRIEDDLKQGYSFAPSTKSQTKTKTKL